MRISDWSSDVCSSDLAKPFLDCHRRARPGDPCSHPAGGAMDARVKLAPDNDNEAAARKGSKPVVKIATWNVNSIKARLGNVTQWLGEAKPDIALLQELKCTAEGLPRMELETPGYNVFCVGQKNYNGVALLSRFPATVKQARLPGDEED